jgi:hypothetical protein
MGSNIESSVVNFSALPVSSGSASGGGGGTITAQTVPIPLNSVVLMRTNIVGYRTGGTAGAVGDSAAYTRTARIKNVAGVVTINDLFSDFASYDQAAWDATFAVSGSNVLVQVTGAVNNNINWLAQTILTVIQ